MCGLQRRQKSSTVTSSPVGDSWTPPKVLLCAQDNTQKPDTTFTKDYLTFTEWWGFGVDGVLSLWVVFFFGGDFLFISYLNICSSQLLPTYLGDVTTECSALEFTVNHSKPFLYSYTIPFLSKQLEHEYFQKAAHMLCSHGAKFGRFEHTWL